MYTSIYICIYIHREREKKRKDGGILIVTVIIIGNEIGILSSNPG